MRNFLTSRHIGYWKNRKIDWRQAYFTPEHPHRDALLKVLKGVRFGSIIEVGCAAGANLHKIKTELPHVEIGGIDINKEAIDMAIEILGDSAAVLEVSSANAMFLSDKSSDCVLTDACLIYIDPLNIDKTIKEIKRVARNHVVFVEFHSKSWIKRLALRIFGGYNAYNYEKLLKKHGFYDIQIKKLSDKEWPGGEPWKTFGHIIVAKNE